MKLDIVQRRAVPVSYIRLMLELAAERGVAREPILRGLDIRAEQLARPNERLSLLQYSTVILRVWQLAKDPTLGYAFGLRCTLRTHGFFGYGVASQASGRAALEFACRYLPLCTPSYALHLECRSEQAWLDVRELVAFGPARQFALEKFMVAFARSTEFALGQDIPELELWFDFPEPAYHAAWRERLPRMRFGMGVNRLVLPARYLGARLATADAITARLVADQYARELLLGGETDDFAASLRAALRASSGGVLSLGALLRRFLPPARRMNRRLRQQGLSYPRLLDEIRHRESVRLLEHSTLPVEAIAAHLGYRNLGRFEQAFVGWAGLAPAAYRAQRRDV